MYLLKKSGGSLGKWKVGKLVELSHLPNRFASLPLWLNAPKLLRRNRLIQILYRQNIDK
jgi:hypothetical protein